MRPQTDMNQDHTQIPFMDLLALLSLVFIALSGMVGIIGVEDGIAERPQPFLTVPTETVTELEKRIQGFIQERDRLLHELEVLQAKASKTTNGGDEALKIREAVAATQEKLQRAIERIAMLMERINSLKRQIAASEKGVQEPHPTESDLEARAAEKRRLEARKKELGMERAELEALLAAAGKETYSFAKGAPMVQKGRVAEHMYLVMLSEGTVRPLDEPYYAVSERYSNAVVLTPQEPGLSVEDAVKPGSPLMKSVLTDEFREQGRVALLVNADSFAAFRVVRDALAARGVDWGWEPYEGTTVAVSLEASDSPGIPSQGGHR